MLMSGDGLYSEIGSVSFQLLVTIDVVYWYSLAFGTSNGDIGTRGKLISGATCDIVVAAVIVAERLWIRGETLDSRFCFLLGVL
ncbi:Hypothetical predicted protein [Olea europaea subsp. europaea]|nr:Hypothetical predicted protein [Olea europaea subsp. europaea]